MRIHGKLLRWGNSYGIRVKKDDAARTGIPEGADVALDIQEIPRKIDLSKIRTFKGGDPDLSVKHDEVEWA